MPAYFLRDVDPMEVKEIRVYNGNSENEFVIMEPGDIAFIVNSIKEISFNKYEICSRVGYWYYLSFISKNREEIVSLGIQNSRFVRSSHTKKQTVILAEKDIPEQELKNAVAKAGYDVVSVSSEPYEKGVVLCVQGG